MPTFGEIYLPDSPHVPLLARSRDLSSDRIIMHSSGRPSFPILLSSLTELITRYNIIPQTDPVERPSKSPSRDDTAYVSFPAPAPLSMPLLPSLQYSVRAIFAEKS